MRRWGLRLAVMLLIVIGLFPPWIYTFSPRGAATTEKPAGYHFLLAPPPPARDQPFSGVALDVPRLLLQYVLGLGIAVGLWRWRKPQG